MALIVGCLYPWTAPVGHPSLPWRCGGCEAPVVISGRMQLLLIERPARILCIPCAAKVRPGMIFVIGGKALPCISGSGGS